MTRPRRAFRISVIELGPKVRDLDIPSTSKPAAPTSWSAKAYLEKGNKQQAAAELNQLHARRGPRSRSAQAAGGVLREELAKARGGRGGPRQTELHLPGGDEDLHRKLGELWLAQGKVDGSIREFQAVIAMDPLDRASAEFNLARAYKEASREDDAMEHVIAALEAAPGDRPAQRLLLELSASQ